MDADAKMPKPVFPSNQNRKSRLWSGTFPIKATSTFAGSGDVINPNSCIRKLKWGCEGVGVSENVLQEMSSFALSG